MNQILNLFKKKKTRMYPRNKQVYKDDTTIYFSCGVNKMTIDKVIRMITKIINANKDNYEGTSKKLEITYVVDSPGGCVDSILKFVSFVEMIKKKYPFLTFRSVLSGCCASAATIMCVCADKRQMMKYAHAMIHELSTGMRGKYKFLLSYIDHLQKAHAALLKVYTDANKNIDSHEIEKLMADETWFSAEQYLKAGFIDEII